MNARPDLSIDITVGLDHLRRLDARGMHQLAALHPEGNEKRFITFCLDPTGEARATSFLREFGSRCNVYYSANEVRLDLGDKRAKKADIQTVRMVIADLDPAKNVVLTPEVLARERERLETVRERVACEDECFYSFAVDSGGGLQLGWLLDEKLPASRFADLAEDQTRGILRHLGAEESTTDITRLCRLPGTLNFPTEAKRRQGRNEVTPARVIEYIGNSNTTLEELAHWAAPVEASRKARATGDAGEIDLDMDAVEAAYGVGAVPPWLQLKLDDLRERDRKFDRLWLGDKSAIGGSDTTRSGFLYSLASRLRRTGQFSPTEFAQLAAIWDHGPEDVDGRQLARAWVRNHSVAAEEEFTAVPEVASLGLHVDWVASFDVNELPKREFCVGRFVAKQYVSALVSPPGVGKTTFLLMMAVAVATGRSEIVGFDIPKRERVFLFNQEDELAELKRRLAAVMTQFDVGWPDLMIDGRPALALGSGADKALMFARKDGEHVVRSRDAIDVEAFIKENGVGLAIFDPFVELHPVDENNNVEIAAVGRIFRRIAVNGRCGVVLAHHTRKPPNAANRESYAGDMDAARGAGALNGVARMGATLYGIDAATAKKYGIRDEEKNRYIRFDDGKANMSLLSGEPRFFRREGVVIGGLGGEEVGVLVPVKLTRAKTATESSSDENTRIRDAVADLLKTADAKRMTIKSVAEELIDTGLAELVSPEALRKRLGRMFEKPQHYENGASVRSETARKTGKQGRELYLILDIADDET
ncbi:MULTISPECIES: AAA family ATPase [unclassified Bradyrhizobium]|uniref:AAA family ATPase n=1 Tax=unclassified Bradyrhizobium TaxID=2631580 RepID=UPI001FF732E4|nr:MULTISPECIES: AAA family ATPase [unclassified Bradyrhizobium]MCK1612509.1 AAA family ATPase [Bradyrhizobium sp. 163]MCK1767059.1 AAA family ATPase [Bradyrhizobium sp. 136]